MRPLTTVLDDLGHNTYVSYFAAVFARAQHGWLGAEAELADAELVDDVTDLMREAAVEIAGDPVLLLVEENDEWFAVIRLDGEEDPRVFISDAHAEGGLADLFHEFVGNVPDGEIGGEPGLLEDLGVAAKRLTELGERALPSDALMEVAEQAGFGEEFDRLRDRL